MKVISLAAARTTPHPVRLTSFLFVAWSSTFSTPLLFKQASAFFPVVTHTIFARTTYTRTPVRSFLVFAMFRLVTRLLASGAAVFPFLRCFLKIFQPPSMCTSCSTTNVAAGAAIAAFRTIAITITR